MSGSPGGDVEIEISGEIDVPENLKSSSKSGWEEMV